MKEEKINRSQESSLPATREPTNVTLTFLTAIAKFLLPRGMLVEWQEGSTTTAEGANVAIYKERLKESPEVERLFLSYSDSQRRNPGPFPGARQGLSC